MTALLTGNTASLVVSNSACIRIKMIDDDSLQYQFISSESADEPLEAEIKYEMNEDSDEFEPCFYTLYGGRYFINEFCRDNIGSDSID